MSVEERLNRTEAEVRRANDLRERIAVALERIADAAEGHPRREEDVLLFRDGPGVPYGPPPKGDILIEELDLTVRAYNCLKRAGYQTASQVAEAAETRQLLAIPNLGRRTEEDVNEALRKWRERR